AAGTAAHHVVERFQPLLLGALAPQQRQHRFWGHALLPAAPSARIEGPPIQLSQSFFGQAFVWHAMPISFSRSRKSASPRESRLRVLASDHPIPLATSSPE